MQRIDTRSAEVGGLPIRRALPGRERRLIGAWCFFDHLGPIESGAQDRGAAAGLHVGPHPHIGLQTFTWMIEGAVVHRDSLGNEQVIRPGEVNLMTAGRGIAHAEDSPAVSSTEGAGRLHAAQLWIALPDRERQRAPAFEHYPQLPRLQIGGFRATLLAGRACGESSPVRVYSDLVGLDLTADGPAAAQLPLDPDFEHACMVLGGEMTIEGEAAPPDLLLHLGSGRHTLRLECAARCRMLLIGGAPFGEEILLWWNFVARTREEIVAASADWNAARRFGEVEGSPSPRLTAPEVPLIRR